MKDKSFFIFLLCLVLAAYTQVYSAEYDQNGRLSILKADLNRDGYFNMVDISLVALAWLEPDCGLDNSCNDADVFPDGGDGSVDFADFAAIAEVFGQCTDPTDPDCIHLPLTLYEPPSGPGGAGDVGIFGTGVAYKLAVPAGQQADGYGSYVGPLSILTRSVLTPSSSRFSYSFDNGVATGSYGGHGYVGPLRRSPGSGGDSFMFYAMSGKTYEPGRSSLLEPSEYVQLGATGFFDDHMKLLPGSGGGSLKDVRIAEVEELDMSLHDPHISGYRNKSRLTDTGSFGDHMRRLPGSAERDLSEDLVEAGEDVEEMMIEGTAIKVNMFSGEVIGSAVDFQINGRGPGFVWKRFYRSLVGPNTVQGNNWDFSYNIYLEPYSGNLVLHDGIRQVFFHSSDPNTWVADGFFRELTREPDGSYTLIFAHKGKWTFNPFDGANTEGKINAITDRNGNSLNFDYDALGRLTTIHDTRDTINHDRDITISYNASGLIASITDWIGRMVTYEYYSIGEPNGSVGDLKSVTSPAVIDTVTGNDFPLGKTTVYSYTKGFVDERLNHNLLTITDPKGQVILQNSYGTDPEEVSFDHVVRQIPGDSNDIIDYTYLQQEPNANNNHAVTKTVINDRMGNVSEHLFDNRNQAVIVRQYSGRANPDLPTSFDPNVNPPTNKLRPTDRELREVHSQYNDDSLPTRKDYPNGNYFIAVYEGDLDPNAPVRSRGNLREMHHFAGTLESVSDQNDAIQLFEFEENTNTRRGLPTHYTNPRGNVTLFNYDPNGNLIRMTNVIPGPDPNIVHEWRYNGFGQVTDHNLPDNGSGHQRRDEYRYYTDSNDPNYGRLEKIVVDANNLALTTTYQYDEIGNLTHVTDPRGHDTQYIYNQLNQVVRRISREVQLGSGIRYQRDYRYDENNNLVSVDIQNLEDQGTVLPNTHITTTFDYDSRNRMWHAVQELDESNSVDTEYEYDDNDNLTLTRFGEATNGNDPNNVVRIFYDERGLVFQTIRAEGGLDQSTTQYDYDGNGNLKKMHQGLEDTPRVMSFQYDGFNRLVEANDPMGNTGEYHYDPTGNIVSMLIEGELIDVPGNNDKTTMVTHYYEYNTLGQKSREQIFHHDPNTQLPIGDGNSITQYFYSDNSQLTKIVDDNGNETLYEYDTANRLGVVTDAKENTATYSYDENSNVISVGEVEISDISSPNETFVTTYQYDNLDRLIGVIDNNSNTIEYAYDSRNNLSLRTDALNHQSRYKYDGLNRLIRTTHDMDGDGADADGADFLAWQEWDDSSRLTAQIDDNSNATAYEYDASNRVTRIIYADDTNEIFVYDVHDNIVQTTDAAGNVIVYVYDLLNRCQQVIENPEPDTGDSFGFGNYKYDGLSRLVYVQDNDSNLTFSYDSLSNVISETLNNKTTTSIYDGLGNKLSCTYPGGRVITTTYDELNRKKTISDANGQIASYSYIGPARIEMLSYGNNTSLEYTYDDVKRITATKHSDNLGDIIDWRTYQWDSMYNKTQRKDTRFGGPKLTHDYAYDAVNHLIQTTVTDTVDTVRDTDYALDGVGNRTGVTGDNCPGTYVMDPCLPEPADFQMNQYTSTPCDSSRSYDKNGNLITIDKGQSIQDITYDYRNQMVEYADPAIGTTITYAYDALGRRIEKVVDLGASVEMTRFFYDHWRLIEEQDITGTTQSTVIYGNTTGATHGETLNDAVLGRQADANDFYYHTDDIFNVMAVTDSNGLIVERYEYQDYGEPNLFDSTGGSIAASAIGNPYLFASRQYDPETGWYYHRSRYFDPKAGRFTTRNTASRNKLKVPWITIVRIKNSHEARIRLADAFTSESGFDVEDPSYTFNSYPNLCISCD